MNLFEQLKVEIPLFLEKAQGRAASLSKNEQVKQDFRNEIQRFLPTHIVADTVNNDRFWQYLSAEIPEL